MSENDKSLRIDTSGMSDDHPLVKAKNSLIDLLGALHAFNEALPKSDKDETE